MFVVFQTFVLYNINIMMKSMASGVALTKTKLAICKHSLVCKVGIN